MASGEIVKIPSPAHPGEMDAGYGAPFLRSEVKHHNRVEGLACGSGEDIRRVTRDIIRSAARG